MKTRIRKYLSVLLAILLFATTFQMNAFAADVQARDVAQAYREKITAAASDSYFVIKNLCGDNIPELIIDSQVGDGDVLHIWSYQNGAAKQIGTIEWEDYSTTGHSLYLTKDGKLAWTASQSPSGVTYEPYTDEYRAGTVYTLNAEGYLEASDSYEYRYRAYSNREEFVSGKINGAASTGAKVQSKHTSFTNNLSTLVLSNRYHLAMPMTKEEANTSLYKITGRFWDVPAGQYYTDAVDWAVENGITSGTSEIFFSPNNACTRAQAVTFLWRAAGSPEPTGEATGAGNPFTDVKTSDYFYKAVLWASENGVTGGTSATKFSPNATCTRAQIVTFMWRACGSPYVGGSTGFGDVPSNAYYADAVKWAVQQNVTSGTSTTKFSPNNSCTRAQIVTFLYRARNISIDPQPVKGWSEVYEDFVINQRFLNTEQEYSFGESSTFSGFQVYLYDVDQDGTPELSISNGESGRSTRKTYVYTCVNGQISYLGVGPTDAAYDPADRVGLIGTYRDGAYMSVTKYSKNGTALTRQTIAEYDNFEGDSSDYVNSLVYIAYKDAETIRSIGWQTFVSEQPVS